MADEPFKATDKDWAYIEWAGGLTTGCMSRTIRELRDRVAALEAERVAPEADAVLSLAAIIRSVDGAHNLGATALAEAILSHPDATTLRRAIREPAACPHIRSNGDSNWCALAEQQAAPEPNQAPAGDHIPAATKMVADGEREELAQWLYRLADERSRNRRLGAQPSLLTRAAALLRQPAPEGLVVQEYVHLDSGARIIRDPSEEQSGGCWVVRNSRHVSPIADFSTVAAALAALEPPQGGEVAP